MGVMPWRGEREEHERTVGARDVVVFYEVVAAARVCSVSNGAIGEMLEQRLAAERVFVGRGVRVVHSFTISLYSLIAGYINPCIT
jgi:hypothetical protein